MVYRGLTPALLCVSALFATDAGREGESGAGALWVAPELVNVHPDAQPCSQLADLRAPELMFEVLDPDRIDADRPQLLVSATREVVTFEWNATTGELSYIATAPTRMFSDLGYATQASAAVGPRCE
jgi:hypothetical protein